MLALRILLIGGLLVAWGLTAVPVCRAIDMGSAPVETFCLIVTPDSGTSPGDSDCEPHELLRNDDYEANGNMVWDPLEPFNRGVFWVNDKLYLYALKPLAKGYRIVVPEPGREAVGNVFNNLGAPVRIVNNALQGKVIGTLDELAIFLANSIFGLGGIIDLHATTKKPAREDFGQTLGHYGIPPGPYLVLPLSGPRNLRDGIGLAADGLVDPFPSPYYLKVHQEEALAATLVEQINFLSLDKDTYEAVIRESLDPYVTIRDAYMQNRAAKIAR
jgi:phospholipid-binding lipoprotein MlaA